MKRIAISIETYAKRLIGKTFADVCKQDDITKAMVVRRRQQIME